MIPTLPVTEIREAIANSDWSQASVLLDQHQQTLHQALASVDLATTERTPWMDLLEAQHELLEEMRVAREAVSDALGQLAQDARGARGWLRELA